MKDIINTPSSSESYTYLPEQGSEFYEIQGKRSTMEDALVIIRDFNDREREAIAKLNPKAIGHRLWTLHRQIDSDIYGKDFADGTTASTTVFDGKGNLITATLADASSFVTIYDSYDKLRGVFRLNSVTHTFKNPSEVKRVSLLGGMVFNHRFLGNLAVSRAIGDHHLNDIVMLNCVCADSKIDIVSLDELYAACGIEPHSVKTVNIISCCDGFTDGAGPKNQNKAGHEAYLTSCLVDNQSTGGSQCKSLVNQALTDQSSDNISVVIQTIVNDGTMVTEPIMVGMYDGHGGAQTASYTANHVAPGLKDLLALSNKEYETHPHSVYQHQARFIKDHPDESLAPFPSEISPLKDSVGEGGFFGKRLLDEQTETDSNDKRLIVFHG